MNFRYNPPVINVLQNRPPDVGNEGGGDAENGRDIRVVNREAAGDAADGDHPPLLVTEYLFYKTYSLYDFYLLTFCRFHRQ